MTSYLSLASRYLSGHKKKTRLTILSVIISVALVTGVFSMMDVFLKYEKIQVIHDNGNYQLQKVCFRRTTHKQKKCRLNTYGTNAKGYITVNCNKCRVVCPMLNH